MNKGFKVGLVAALLAIACQCPAQIFTLTDANSIAQINMGSQAGMFYWGVQSSPNTFVNQLNQQWFWYRVGSNPEQSIDTISPVAISGLTAKTVTATYFSPAFSIGITYSLQGGSPLSGTADISEQIAINNISGAPLDFHFFQYSDFDLTGSPGGDTVVLSKNAFTGRYNQADQFEGPSLVEVVNTPNANHGEADVFPNTLNRLNDGVPTTLDDTKLSASGDVTWALQWDVNIAPGGSFLISKDKHLDLHLVPEPGALAFGSLILGLLAMRRRFAGN